MQVEPEDRLRLILMLAVVVLTIVLQVTGCSTPPLPRQDEAVNIVAHTYIYAGLKDPRPVEIIWYVDQQCIPSPFDPEHDTRCRVGRSVPLGFVCQVEVVWRGDAFSATSLAHELLHCSLRGNGDGHEDGTGHWGRTLSNANLNLSVNGL